MTDPDMTLETVLGDLERVEAENPNISKSPALAELYGQGNVLNAVKAARNLPVGMQGEAVFQKIIQEATVRDAGKQWCFPVSAWISKMEMELGLKQGDLLRQSVKQPRAVTPVCWN